MKPRRFAEEHKLRSSRDPVGKVGRHALTGRFWPRCQGPAPADAGRYNDPATGKPINRNVGEMLALIHSEISEALEGHRKRLMDDHLPHRRMVEVVLADAVIRIADLAGYLDLDLGGAIVEKLEYNRARADHKLENRAKAGGKVF